MNAAAAAFAATECIKAGEWDGYLSELWRVVRERRILTDRSKSPTIPTPERHQVWAWMNYPDMPTGGQWEICGTGLVLDPETEREHLARRARSARS